MMSAGFLLLLSFVLWFLFAVLGLELRAYTLSHFNSPFL
jgi:nitrate/nitrite transporter NarK